MSLNIESTWDLRCDSIPRCLAVDIAPSSIVISSSSGTAAAAAAAGGSGGSSGGLMSAYSSSSGNNKSITATGGTSNVVNTSKNASMAAAATRVNKIPNRTSGSVTTPRSSTTMKITSTNPFDELFEKKTQLQQKKRVQDVGENRKDQEQVHEKEGEEEKEEKNDRLASRAGGAKSRRDAPKQSTNPFEEEDYNDNEQNQNDDENDTTTAAAAAAGGGNNDNYTITAKRYSSSSQSKSGYAILIGTELGTMQRRTFPTPGDVQKNRNAFSSMDTIVSPFGYDGTASDRVPALFQPLNVESDKKSPMVACIRAVASTGMISLTFPASKWNRQVQPTSSSGSSSSSSSSSIYLVLFNDRPQNGGGGSGIGEKTSMSSKYHHFGAYSSEIVALHHLTNSHTTIFSSMALPTMSCATYHVNTGFVYAAGKSIRSLPPDVVKTVSSAVVAAAMNGKGSGNGNMIGSGMRRDGMGVVQQDDIWARPKIYYDAVNLLPLEVRSNPDAICTACKGRIVVIACGNTFYAVSGTCVPHGTWFTKEEEEQMEEAKAEAGASLDHCAIGRGFSGDEDGAAEEEGRGLNKGHDVEKVLKFRQSSQVHPAIVVEVPESESDGDEYSGGNNYLSTSTLEQEVFTSQLFLASGRECAVVDILYNPRLYSNSTYNRSNSMEQDVEDASPTSSPGISCGSIVVGPPRHGVATLVSPILSAVGIQWNNKRCGPLMAILTNDGLVQTRSPSCISIPLSTIEVGTNPNDYFVLRALPDKHVVAVSYGGEGRLISFREDTVQDFANRMVKLSVDAFGSNGFPRAELAEAVNAKFSATSYVGPEPTNSARTILKQYLEMVLGLDKHDDLGGTEKTSWLFGDEDGGENKVDPFPDQNSQGNHVREPHASVLVAATAILCLACSRISPPNPSLANRAAKSCAAKLGVVCNIQDSGINSSTVRLCKKVMEYLLEETKVSSVDFSTPTRNKVSNRMEFLEAAIWLLRLCAEHVLAIEVTQNSFDLSQTRQGGSWSQLKYESFLATHLGELWSHGDDSCRDVVLNLSTTRQLIETNPLLGLGIFTSSHPKTGATTSASLTSMEYPKKVIELLKSIRPVVRGLRDRGDQMDASSYSDENNSQLPLESGRALTVTYLESLVGISTKASSTNLESPNILSDMHNELALLLLEGVLAEQCDDKSEGESQLGSIYRSKLRRLLGWSNAVNPETLMSVLPKSFLRERALVLGQLGRHEDALRIFYCQLDSLDLALEYCDARFEKISAQNASKTNTQERGDSPRLSKALECPYLPLISVALQAHNDSDRGIESAIKVLSLRRDKIDRSAALRLLPKNIPMSSLSQSFLVPALIDSESQARRMEVVAALLRAKYVRLKRTLTETQIKSQSSIHAVPGLRSLNLGQPIYTSKPFKARPSSLTSYNFPDISITKYFFPRYVVIQASVFNCAPHMRDKSLGDVQLVVAESSEDALLPSIHIPIKTLPPEMTGSSWCVLAASPQRLDISAILTCEMRYNIIEVDSTTGAPLSFNGGHGIPTKSIVEEIQDIEIRRAEFEGLSRLD